MRIRLLTTCLLATIFLCPSISHSQYTCDYLRDISSQTFQSTTCAFHSGTGHTTYVQNCLTLITVEGWQW